MTRMVFKALGMASAAQQQAWLDASWSGGVARAPDLERLLIETRTRADAYRSLEELDIDRLCEWLGVTDSEQ